MYYDWQEVHQADGYLAEVERMRDANADWSTRSTYFLDQLSAAGHEVGNTTSSVFARVAPPRSEGTEAILLSANWLSRDGVPNVRGIALLLSLAKFFRGQNQYAFDIFLVIGDDYLSGLEDFMTAYKPRANIWTGLNIDYPYHSFKSIGIYYGELAGQVS